MALPKSAPNVYVPDKAVPEGEWVTDPDWGTPTKSCAACGAHVGSLSGKVGTFAFYDLVPGAGVWVGQKFYCAPHLAAVKTGEASC